MDSKPPGAPAEKPRHGSRLWLAILVAVVCVGGVVWLVKYRQGQAAAKAKRSRGDVTAPVVVGKVVNKTLPIYLDGLGTVQAFNIVTVKSLVDGQLIKVAFTEGQDVHAGDLLAQIDPAPFQAALEQVEAKKAQDEAQLTNAKRDLERDQQLIKDKIVTEQALETQESLVTGLEATVKADQAAIQSASVQLKYGTITAPIDGRCGLRLVDQGNIVHPNDTNGLVVITQLRPISIVFTLPEQYTGQIAAKLAQGGVTVLALDRDNKTSLGTGKLAVIDNQIDPQTGTIKLKATFPNDDLKLWPGQFVNARAIVESRTGLVVPSAVIQRGPSGEYAFVVKDGVAKVQPLKVSQTQDGLALVEDAESGGGLREGDSVVVDGQNRLQDGSKVTTGDQTGGGKGHGGRGGTNAAAMSKRMTNSDAGAAKE
ncbi:MAG TPA: efflux RND transporter periplasmic adaptor subunit [Verrucomicrobiae bacterium]|nr:efflux RND transporter periplasmic adaptor subunit [Verrucomicrobiae bacterium]